MSPPAIWWPTRSSPSSASRASSQGWRRSSTGAGGWAVAVAWAAGVSAPGLPPAAFSSPAAASVATSPGPSGADDNGGTPPAGRHVLLLDPLLQQDDALEQRLGPRRTAGDVDVDRDDLIDALRDRVGVPIGAPAVGAAPHGDDVLGVGHLLVQTANGRGHLVGDRPGDDDEVRLSGAGGEGDHPETHDVVAGRAYGRAQLEAAAGQPPLVDPQRVLPRRVEQLGERLGHVAALD